MNDLDLSGINWDPIGEGSPLSGGSICFTGIFDGNGHTINNLTINKPDEDTVGLFGSIGDGAEIKNLGLVDVDIYGGDTVGAIAAYNVGSTGNTLITNCFVTGNVAGTGNNSIGGICGAVAGSATISNSYVNVDVIGEGAFHSVGGIAGAVILSAKVSNCYALGNATGGIYVGGIVGMSNTGIVENCFWLEDTPGSSDGIGNDQGTSNNNSGLTSDEIQNSDNFTDAGWDENIWDFSNGTPTLKPVPQPPSSATEENIIRLQIGSNSKEISTIYVDTGFNLGNLDFDYTTEENCTETIKEIDRILGEINTKRSEIGAAVNRINSILDSQTTTIENYTAAKSTIMDADIATESADYVKNQILQQTSSTLLAQSQNLHSSIVLSLIQ